MRLTTLCVFLLCWSVHPYSAKVLRYTTDGTSGGTVRWLVDSGCESIVERSPNEGQKGIVSAAAVMKRAAAGLPPWSVNVTMLPNRSPN